MDTTYLTFVNSFKDLISDCSRYLPDHVGCLQYLKVSDQVNMPKVIRNFMTIFLKNNYNISYNVSNLDFFLANKDQEIIIFPEINLSSIMPKLNKHQQSKVFKYLRILYVSGGMLLNTVNETQNTQSTQSTNATQVSQASQSTQALQSTQSTLVSQIPQPTFNPYAGININLTSNSTQEYNIADMYSGPMTLPEDKDKDSKSSFNIESLLMKSGLSKLIDVKELTSQLKNITTEDQAKLTSSLKEILGDNDVATNLITNIKESIDSEKIDDANPFKSLVNIASSVVSKIKPQLDNGTLDLSKVMQNMTSKDGPLSKLNTQASQENKDPDAKPDPQAEMLKDALSTMQSGGDPSKILTSLLSGLNANNDNKDPNTPNPAAFLSQLLGGLTNNKSSGSPMDSMLSKLIPKRKPVKNTKNITTKSKTIAQIKAKQKEVKQNITQD